MFNYHLPLNRYTDHDPDYRVVVERSVDGPAPPPKMENWPPPQQQRRNRRPRDNWYK